MPGTGKRRKHVKKYLVFYKQNYEICSPFKIIVDGTFCKAALSNKVNIGEQLPKYLDGEVLLRSTKCVLAECIELGSLLFGPLKVLQQYDVEECGHVTPTSASACLRRMAKHSEKLFIATQDPEVSEAVRRRAGVPLLFLSRHAVTLEAPSAASRAAAQRAADTRMTDKQHTLSDLKKSVLGEEAQPKKRKGPKGVNPLSCKKAKVKVREPGNRRKTPRARHRRVRLAAHVREQLAAGDVPRCWNMDYLKQKYS